MLNSIFSHQIFAQEENKTHFRYLNQNEKFNLGDSFYRNSDYFKCEARQVCNKESGVDAKAKKFAYFLGREEDGFIIPVFLQCYRGGNATISTAENLVPLLNEEVLENGDCIKEEVLEESVSTRLASDTLKAVRSYKGKCPKGEDDKTVLGEIFNSFIGKDLKNLGKKLTGKDDGKTEVGCIGNLLSNIADSLYHMVKMFVWDAPKALFRMAKGAWNDFFNEEEERSESMLLSSMMSQDMAKAISDWDLPKFYSLLRKNFFDFFGSVKEYFSETIACTEWDGIPYNSTCTKKPNWSCPSIEHSMNWVCGMASQLGTGYFLGAMLGTAKSLSKMRSLRRKIADEPKKFGITGKFVDELKSKVASNEMLNKASAASRRAKYRLSRKSRGLTDFLSTQVTELKFLLGIGDSFVNLVKATPLTNFYHKSYQAGQQKGWKFVDERAAKNVGEISPAIKQARASALRLDNIQEKFDDLVGEFKRLKGNKFDPVIFKEAQKEYFQTVAKELRKNPGYTVKPIEGGQGLKISYKGESFDYLPRLEEKVRGMSDKLSDDGMRDIFKNGDPILGSTTASTLGPEIPDFWKNYISSSERVRGMFTLKPNGTDGFVYMGHFLSQTRSRPKTEDCSAKLNNVEVLRSQDITDIDEDGKQVEEEPVAPSEVIEDTKKVIAAPVKAILDMTTGK